MLLCFYIVHGLNIRCPFKGASAWISCIHFSPETVSCQHVDRRGKDFPGLPSSFFVDFPPDNLEIHLIRPLSSQSSLGVQTPSPDNDDGEDSDGKDDEEGKKKKSVGAPLDPSSVLPSPNGTPSVENSGDAESAAKEDQVLLDTNVGSIDRLIYRFLCDFCQ